MFYVPREKFVRPYAFDVIGYAHEVLLRCWSLTPCAASLTDFLT